MIFNHSPFSSCPCCKDMPLQRNTSASSVVAPLLTYHPDQPVPCHIRRQRRAAISFSALHCGQFLNGNGSHTVRDVRRHLQTILTATTKVFNQCPVGGRFPQRCWQNRRQAENLYRNVVTFAFRYQLPARRDREVTRIIKISNQSCRGQAQTRPTICW